MKVKVRALCLECGRRFYAFLGRNTCWITCPKCKGTDVELDG